jgi:hypothetical protein
MFCYILTLGLFILNLASATVSDCSNGGSVFKVTSMSFTPDPMVKGQNSTLLLSMSVPEVITDGTARYTTTYNFIPFSPTVEALCGVTIPCPVTIGNLDTYSSFPADSSLSGSIQVKIEWTDQNSRQLLCILIKTKA